MIASKPCSTCGVIKPFEEFSPDKRKKSDGLQARCKACNRERTREWARQTRDERREAHRKWREANPEWRREYNRAYRERNRDRLDAEMRRWYNENVERHRENGRRWARANPDKMRRMWRANHKRRELEAEALDYAEIIEHDPCAYCGDKAGTIDHIEPVVRGGSNSWTNLAAACKSCNSRKAARPLLIALLSI